MMNGKRRLLLAASAAYLGSALFPTCTGRVRPGHAHAQRVLDKSSMVVSRHVPGFDVPLRIAGRDGLLGLAATNGPLQLTARIDRHALFPGRTTDLWNFTASSEGRTLLNPTLRLRRGDLLDVTLRNALGEDTTIHWHGLAVDERNDGSGMQPVRNGADYVYRFPVDNRAGLYWYHPHPHDRTGAQVHQGMGGLLMVDDAEEDALRKALGVEPGLTELALLVSDKQVDDRNRIKYSMGEDDWIGNRMLVNWTPEPYLDAMTCLYRFRILNGSNARVYRLAFVTNGKPMPFTLIGTDGGLLDRPRQASEVFLAPAQRIDVLVDFGKMLAGSTVMLASLPYDPMENEAGPAIDPAIEHPGAPLMGEPIDLMKINLKIPVCAPRSIPQSLSAPPPMPATRRAPRKLLLHMNGPKWFINGYNFHDDMRAVKFAVKRGSVEHWDIRNDIVGMPHPMHVHGFQFHVVRRLKSPPQVRRLALDASGRSAQDFGLQDTVLVWPGETVRIAIDFSQPFGGTQRYMFHCHNLEHEDQGMMLAFAVEP